MTAADETAAKKPGRKSRADIEAEIREQVLAEERAKIEADVRDQIAREEAEARAIREAEGKAVPVSGSDISGDPQAEGAVTIHFVEDGFTILGKVWYVGEPLTLNPGTENWELSKINFRGTTRVFATLTEDEQITLWGKRIFRDGPGQGSTGFAALLDNPDLTADERTQLEKAARLHEERYGALAK